MRLEGITATYLGQYLSIISVNYFWPYVRKVNGFLSSPENRAFIHMKQSVYSSQDYQRGLIVPPFYRTIETARYIVEDYQANMSTTLFDNDGGLSASKKGTLKQHGDIRPLQDPDTTASIDIRLLLNTTIMTLSTMAMAFGISNYPGFKKRRAFLIYSTVMFCVLLCGLGLMLYTSFEEELVTAIESNVWAVQSVTHFAIFYVASVRPSGMSKFYEIWQAYRNMYSIKPGAARLKSHVCVIVVWLFTILSINFSGYLTFAHWKPTDRYWQVFSIINFLISIYYSFAWIASSGFTMLIGSLLSDEYKLINEEIRASQVSSSLLNQSIGNIRRRHWELSQIVGKADDILCAHLGLNVVASLILSCLKLYILIWSGAVHGNIPPVVIQFAWFLFACLKLSCICIAGTILNDAVSIIYKSYVRSKGIIVHIEFHMHNFVIVTMEMFVVPKRMPLLIISILLCK